MKCSLSYLAQCAALVAMPGRSGTCCQGLSGLWKREMHSPVLKPALLLSGPVLSRASSPLPAWSHLYGPTCFSVTCIFRCNTALHANRPVCYMHAEGELKLLSRAAMYRCQSRRVLLKLWTDFRRTKSVKIEEATVTWKTLREPLQRSQLHGLDVFKSRRIQQLPGKV